MRSVASENQTQNLLLKKPTVYHRAQIVRILVTAKVSITVHLIFGNLVPENQFPFLFKLSKSATSVIFLL